MIRERAFSGKEMTLASKQSQTEKEMKGEFLGVEGSLPAVLRIYAWLCAQVTICNHERGMSCCLNIKRIHLSCFFKVTQLDI